jgi:universal stress protein E
VGLGSRPLLREMMAYAGIAAERVEQEPSASSKRLSGRLPGFSSNFGIYSVNYSARLVEGYGAPAIAGVVEQAKPDLLVIETRGFSG